MSQNNEVPEKITLDGSRASHQALIGIELANKIKKGQFDTSEITSPGAMILQVWKAALAA